MYRLIASDMDDTLLNAEGILTPRTLRALGRAMDAGVSIVLASGRMLESTAPFAEQLKVNAPLIVYNGAMVYDFKEKRALEMRTVPAEAARGICKMAEELGVYVQAYPGEGYFAQKRTPYTGQYEDSVKVDCGITGTPLSQWISSPQVKLLAIGEKENTLSNIEKFRAAFPDVSFMMSRPNYIEIVAKGVDKKDALERTLNDLGIAPEEALAFGDGQNDVAMLNFVGLGYCVENASENVRAQCKNFCPANTRDGCAIIIERLLDEGALKGAQQMVKEADFVKAMGLSPVVPAEGKYLPIDVTNVNRPGLQLAGYWDFFAHERPQLLGKVEMTYLSMLDEQSRRERLTKFFSYDLPCIIICRGLPCFDEMLVLGVARKIPIYSAKQETTQCEMEVINFLSDALAPRETRHGVLVDVYGSGLFITGNSGVGKSEAALELVNRGHRLVADDVVDIRRVSENRLVGEAPELVRHFMEIRGVGIIDIATMYGIGSIIRSKSIDFEVHMELWQDGKEYDRLGLTDNYTEILNVKIPRLLLPIHPGRNIAAVLEVAASNFRLKQMGYNAAEVLTRRHMERAMRGADGE